MFILDYILLEKLYYKNKNLYETEYLNRFTGVSSIKFGININKNQAFVIITPEIINQIYKITTISNNLNVLFQELPGIALNRYIKRCLVEEIIMTNEIEGVISTKKDISEILERVGKSNKHKRLYGLVNKYQKLDEDEILSITNCQDIKNIYTDLVWEEIYADNPENLPDGMYFRKNGVDIISKFNKVIHRGVMPEEEINIKMSQALYILNDEKINILIRIAVFHYLFGYIHPFYDGNGRTSRFISSYLLSKNLNVLTGYRLSYIIKENIAAYYKSFKIVNESKNLGDVTPFIINFFDIIIKVLDNLYSSLSEKLELIQYYYNISKKLSEGKKDNNKIIFILFQETLFGGEGISIADLITYSKISEYKIRQVISELKKLKLLEEYKIGRKPLYKFDLDKICNLDY